MVTISNKIVTYSLLAHINDHNEGIRDLSDLFIPLVKRVLAKMADEGIHQGKHINEIKNRIDQTYYLDIPYPLLIKIIESIADEVVRNKGSEFIIYKDKAFQINNYTFSEFEEDIAQEESNIEKLEQIYDAYLEINGIKKSNDTSLIDFIDKNRAQLITYFSDKKESQDNIDKDFFIQANFINYVKSDPKLYKIICKVYLGSIIASYLEYEPEFAKEKGDKEFLLDTNFIIGLLDLNTIESTHTCRKIVDICKRLNYRVSVLDYTIEETKNLIERTANSIDTIFLQKKLDPESIYNACDRRNLSKTDLEKLLADLESILRNEFSINIINDTTKVRNEAKYSKEYEIYKGVRSTEWSALHDATAVKYIQRKRGKKFKDYFSANCFFVTNTTRDFRPLINSDSVSEIIRAEDLVNILWLTNPNVKLNVNNEEVVNIGLSRLISSSINSRLPSSRILRELDENIQKYARDKISDRDIIRVANRIANKTLVNLEQLNKIANKSPIKFVERLASEAKKEEEREKKLVEKFKSLLTVMLESSDEKVKEKLDIYKKEYDRAVLKLKEDSEAKIAKITQDTSLQSKQNIFNILDRSKKQYDTLASKKSFIVIGSVLIPPIIVLLLIHFLVDDKILDKISLIGVFIWPIITFFYFAITKKEWNLKEIHKSISDKFSFRYYKKFDFDIEVYNQLKKELDIKN
jgi:hypothetical protein|uniref:hypothetical protein n=1 Tax=Ignavibacterium sp. TaxID=2651167 RepID=UPI0025B8F967